MKNIIRISGILLTIILIHSCKKDKVPTLTTSEVTGILATTATSGGTITDEGSGTIISRGVCWSTNNSPIIADNKTIDGSGAGNFSSNITGLNGGATYYVRAYATNGAGTGYGNQITFTTSSITLALLTTTDVASITSTSAISGGNITTDGGGSISTRGVCWGTSTNPTTDNNKTSDGTGLGSFASNVSGLHAGMTYYLRAYATNSAGTAYGDLLMFNTLSEENDTVIVFNPELIYSSVSDIDGNIYKTIQIGTQVWMAQNLKTTKYSNGDLIGTTNPPTMDIRNEASPKYQWAFNGDENTVQIYGRLYTWYAVIDSRNVCPTGWHVATDPEWTLLTTFLGGNSIAGSKLKETGTTHWSNPNEADNSSGFTALPSGGRTIYAQFYKDNITTLWWSSSQSVYAEEAIAWGVDSPESGAYPGNTVKIGGFSVRCLKDN